MLSISQDEDYNIVFNGDSRTIPDRNVKVLGWKYAFDNTWYALVPMNPPGLLN